MKFPRHLALTIIHNDHNTYYEDIIVYLDRPHIDDEDISPEDREEIIKTNSIWEIQWYPDTPNGFYYVAAATLERCLEIIYKKWEEDE